MKKRIAAWIALGIITVCAGLLLSMTNEVTKDVIAQQEADAKVQARMDVLPAAEEFTPIEMSDLEPVAELYVGNAAGAPQGYVGTAIAKGYGGPVQVIAGLDAEGKITGISVGGSEFAETAGLGAKAKDAAFVEQFKGKQTPVRAVKSAADRGDNTIDAITAATITSNAVTGAVNSIASKVDAYLNPDSGDLVAEGTTYTASAQGFAGPVAVFVTVKDDGTISALRVGDDAFAETEGFGASAKEPAFTKQFTGKALPITVDSIDGVAGATITTNAVVEAINKAFADKVVVEPAAPEGTRYTASEQGFAGPVAVFVTVKDDGTITALSIGDDQFAETENFGAGAKEAGFTKQFVGKTLPLESGDIDGISGATITTEAVVRAINKAYADKLVDETAGAAVVEETVPATSEAPTASEEPAATDVPELPEGARVLTSSSKGYGGPVAVTVTLNEDDTIAALTVGDADFAETQGLGSKVQDEEFTKQFIGKKVPLPEGDVDLIAGATISSEAVIKAINKTIETGEETAAPDEATEAPAEDAAPKDKSVTSSSKGYGGPVAVTVTLNEDDIIAALTVGDADFAETQGLGSKVQDEEFTKQFIGKKVPLQEGDIDLIAGATISSEAVIKAINKTVETAEETAAPDEATEAPAEEAVAEGKSATSSSKGYGGPVSVTVTLNDDDTIEALTVGDADFAETQGLGSKVQDEEFIKQFIGKKVPLQEGDIDLIAGATISSEAVIKAINKTVETAEVTAAPSEATEAPAEDAAAEGKSATSSSKGYGGPVAVTVTLNEDDIIAALTVGDADFAETQGLGSKVQDEEFTKQFIGKKVPLQEGDIDLIAGATISSEAVIKAINKAVEQLVTVEAPRTATSSSKGYGGPVAVTVTLNDDDTISELAVGDADFAETQGLGSKVKDEEFTKQFIGKKVPLQEGDIDLVAGATISSEAVVKAINKAIETLLVPTGEARNATSSSKGYGGPVAVTVTLNEDDTIAELTVGDADFSETQGLGSKVQDEAFTQQFIGKKVPLQEGDIDLIAGATISSEAVVKAINKAVESLLK